MKVIIQVPCYNEEATLPLVLATLPRSIPGVDCVETLIVDDGSTDKTVEVATKLGVDHIVRHAHNMGLARAFHDGVNRALELGADIVVNTDGDNQYPQERIPDLIRPILDGTAEIVVADRQTATIAHFSPFKRLLQRFGSFVVNHAAGTKLPDAASGFRAYSRGSLMRLNTITRFSYCMETIIQAGNKGLAITSIPVTTNPKTRESRLFKSNFQHVRKSATAIFRGYIMYRPHVIFGALTGIFLVLGLVPFFRFLAYTINHEPGQHLQSLIVGAVMLIAAFLSLTLGIVADLIRTNRTLIEDQLERVKESQYRSRDFESQRPEVY